MKKLLIIMLFILPLFACGKSNGDTSTEDKSQIAFFSYKKSSGGITIMGLKGDYPDDIIIPETINQTNVNRVESGCFNGTHVKSVRFPEGLQEIGKSIFKNCQTIEKIAIRSYFSLDDILFECQTPNLKEIEFLDGSKKMLKGFYNNIPTVEKLYFPNTIDEVEEDSLKGFTNVKEISIPGHLSYNKLFYLNGINAKTVNINDGSDQVCAYSFSQTSVEVVNIAASVLTIYRYAFATTPNLKTVNFLASSKLRSIQASAFAGSNISSIALPNCITHIGDGCFYDSKLTSLILPTSLTKINKGIIDKTNILELTIPSSVLEIVPEAFNKVELEKIIFTSSNIKMTEVIFKDCSKLEEIICQFPKTDRLGIGLWGYEDIITWGE